MPYIRLVIVIIINYMFSSPWRYFLLSKRGVCPSQGIQVGAEQRMHIMVAYFMCRHSKNASLQNMILFVNPWRACAARVTVVGLVCLLSHISPTERLFILKMLSRTQQATKVKQFVGICLKRLRSRVMP